MKLSQFIAKNGGTGIFQINLSDDNLLLHNSESTKLLVIILKSYFQLLAITKPPHILSFHIVETDVCHLELNLLQLYSSSTVLKLSWN